MEYLSRFVKLRGQVISDRGYNVKSIAEASMGTSSVLYCSDTSGNPNSISLSVRPNAADGEVYGVKMKILSRFEEINELPYVLGRAARPNGSDILSFDADHMASKHEEALLTSETVRQEIRLNTEDLRISPIVKEIETSTIFRLEPVDKNSIVAWQRTCTYLTRSDDHYVDAKGRPVDLRWYNVQYSRV